MHYENFEDQYLVLRRIIGVVGIIFPLILLVGSLVLYKEIPRSFSNTYGTALRDHFVGTLFVIGFFIGSYKGYDKWDRLICTLIGINSVLAALFPVTSTIKVVEVLHYVFAGIVFLNMAFMSIFLFTKSDRIHIFGKKKLRNRIYRVCGVIMLFLLFLIGFLPLVLGREFVDSHKIVFWLETLLLWAFAIPWVIKGRTLYSGAD